jgi:hypothetical protein
MQYWNLTRKTWNIKLFFKHPKFTFKKSFSAKKDRLSLCSVVPFPFHVNSGNQARKSMKNEKKGIGLTSAGGSY